MAAVFPVVSSRRPSQLTIGGERLSRSPLALWIPLRGSNSKLLYKK